MTCANFAAFAQGGVIVQSEAYLARIPSVEGISEEEWLRVREVHGGTCCVQAKLCDCFSSIPFMSCAPEGLAWAIALTGLFLAWPSLAGCSYSISFTN